jgi:hypothetical protein
MSDNEEITSILLLNATQAKEALKDPAKVVDLPDSIKDYQCEMQLLIDLCAKVKESRKDNFNYTQHIAQLEHDLDTVNTPPSKCCKPMQKTLPS